MAGSGASAHRRALGDVFLSHASVDKPFVRRLEKRLRREGFQTWLDEKEMFVGDALPREVSAALSRARAVVMVISDASVKSPWVRHEITQAAHRMVSGQCRLVPVIIDDVPPPDELTGLIYADCRRGRRGGTARIIAALDAEALRVWAMEATLDSSHSQSRSRGIDRLVEQVFGFRGWAFMQASATRSVEWEVVTLDFDGSEVDVVVDDILDRLRSGEELTRGDWDDWKQHVLENINARYGLLISERPPSRELRDSLQQVGEEVYAEPLAAGIFEGSGFLVLVSLSGQLDDDTGRQRIERARDALLSAAKGQEQPMISREELDSTRRQLDQ